MKTTKLTIIALLIVGNALSQRPDFSETCKKEMQKLTSLTGDWKGNATVRNQNGTLTLEQTEHIEWKMDGLVLSIEGTGTDQGKVMFKAFAVVNYDPTQQQFKFKSFVKEGFSTDAYFKVITDNKFEWGFDIPSGGKSRYTITLDTDKKTWYEVGEFSRDGSTWMKFIEMNLTKL